MQLSCVFGDARATETQRWSDNTLVCVLPPREVPGVVAVWFEGIEGQQKGMGGQGGQGDGEEDGPPVLFAYTDESDRALYVLHFSNNSALLTLIDGCIGWSSRCRSWV